MTSVHLSRPRGPSFPAFAVHPSTHRLLSWRFSFCASTSCRRPLRRRLQPPAPRSHHSRMNHETVQDAASDTDELPASSPDKMDDLINAVATPLPNAAPSKATKPQYSQRARLREETEAPFRKARMFVYAGSAASAGVGAFIAGLRIIAALIGVSGTQPLNETVPNVGINLAVITVCALLLRAEVKAGERRLERMSRGARIASLRVQDSVTQQVLRLKDLRGRTRVVLVTGTEDKVLDAMSRAEAVKSGLSESNLIIVPHVVSPTNASEEAMRSWRMQPYAQDEWNKWYHGERDVARARLGAKAEEVLVLIVRLDGKVGARSAGAPAWQNLIEEISKMPARDQYGKP